MYPPLPILSWLDCGFEKMIKSITINIYSKLWSLLLVDSFYLTNFRANIIIRGINCEILFRSFAFECSGIWVILAQAVVLTKNSPVDVNFYIILSSIFMTGIWNGFYFTNDLFCRKIIKKICIPLFWNKFNIFCISIVR